MTLPLSATHDKSLTYGCLLYTSTAGLAARMMPPMTATPTAPLAKISGTIAASMPPMAMIGTRVVAAMAAKPAKPRAGP